MPSAATRQPTVCLSMIVKNEAHVIERCLASARPLVSAFAIVDTGSTDGTQERVRELMRDLPGEVHERPWRDFASNRNEALALAVGTGPGTTRSRAPCASACSRTRRSPRTSARACRRTWRSRWRSSGHRAGRAEGSKNRDTGAVVSVSVSVSVSVYVHVHVHVHVHVDAYADDLGQRAGRPRAAAQGVRTFASSTIVANL
jgi:glycosyltransferase involved in cell wall biosynthesis